VNNVTLILLVIAAGALAFAAYRGWRRERDRQRLQFIQRATFPASAYRKLRESYPHLTAAQEEFVASALRDYFRIALDAQRRVVAMPSKAVDVLWHEFILATHEYHRFCKKAFGYYLHHVPNEAMGNADHVAQSVKRCWRIACRLENIDPLKPERLPRLFRVDAELNIADGYRYSLDCRQPGRETPYCGSHMGCSSCGGGGSGGGVDPAPGDAGTAGDGGGSSCGGGGCGGGGD
jgi:hypothetical protein